MSDINNSSGISIELDFMMVRCDECQITYDFSVNKCDICGEVFELFADELVENRRKNFHQCSNLSVNLRVILRL